MCIFSLDAHNGDFINIARHTDVVCPMHLHSSAEIVCVTDGLIEMMVSDRLRTIRKGEATIVMPFERHSFETPDSSRCFVIEFSQDIADDFMTLTKDKIPGIPVCKIDSAIFNMCDKNLPESNCAEKLAAKSVLYPLLSDIYNKCTFVNSGTRHEKIFIEATRYACDNFKNGITLKSTAKALGVHHVYLSRMFTRECGMSFTKYLNGLRCSHAIRLLQKGELNSAEIAYQSGFGSIRSFNREFKETLGTTPGNFRKTVADTDKL